MVLYEILLYYFFQGAKESLDKGISLWLPQMRRLAAPEDDTSVAMDSAACSLFDVTRLVISDNSTFINLNSVI